MFRIGDIVLIKHDRSKGAVIAIDEHESTIQYRVLVNGIIGSYFESQLEAVTINTSLEVYSAQEVNALLAARLLLNPNINSLYSLNTAKINFIGEITKGIYDIVESYTLTPDERREKLQQLRDNKVRLIQETERMESEKHTFFGLDMSESVMKKELEDATNIHLSEIAIVNLVEMYLKKKLGDSKTYIVGSDKIKTLRLNEENRNKLLLDFNKLPRQINPTYRAWEGYLKGAKKFDKVTFDGKCAAENPDALFVMPMHPLVKQAIASFEHDPVTCVLKTKNKDLPCGKYPFFVYEWQYKGIKPNCRLQVITEICT